MNTTYNNEQLAAMKPAFIAWLNDNCPCDGPCECYGRHEYDDVHLATIDEDAVIIHYGDRTLTLEHDGEPFITSGALTWTGDDCDYYGNIVCWLADSHSFKY